MLRPLLLLFFCLAIQSCRRPGDAADAKPPQRDAQTKLAAHGGLVKSPGVNTPSAASSDAAALLRPLIDPAKLPTLGDRGTNTRIQKITAILWDAKGKGHDPATVADQAIGLIGWGGSEKGRLTTEAMVRNVTILERLGGTTPEDLDDMRHGRTATVRKGPYAGEILSVDHIIPRAIAPELDNVIANLELMPLSINQRKGNRVGDRQISEAKAFHRAGLLSDAGFQRVMAAKR